MGPLLSTPGAQGEEVVDGDWFDVEPRTIGEQVTKYACDLKFESTGRRVAAVDVTTSPPTILGFSDWPLTDTGGASFFPSG